jgi:GTPase SAR1 family protein
MSITSSAIGKRTFKIILLGDSSTGKTSIIERFINNKFEEKDNVNRVAYSPPSASIS